MNGITNITKKVSTIIFFTLLSIGSLAQTPDEQIEMADLFRSSGKIYVVIAVLSIVLIGLVIFLFRIDRKLSRLEKDIQSRKS